MKEEIIVGEVHVVGERAVVPIVRSVLATWEGGVYCAAEPAEIVVVDTEEVIFLALEDAEIPRDILCAAVKKAYLVLHPEGG